MEPKRNTPIALVSGESKSLSWHSVDHLHGAGKNQWKNWYCSAGIKSLYVDFDGNVFAGTCRVGGWYGNVFSEGPSPDWKPGSWLKCSLENCQCGADMFSPKVKRRELVPERLEDLYQKVDALGAREVDEVSEPDVIISQEQRIINWVTWDIGRRCNYDCSYCFRDAHNNYEAHKSLASLKHAIDWLYLRWSPHTPIKFIITGGEPTVNPSYLEFVEYIMSRATYGNKIQTTTNGSRDPEFYSRLIRSSAINFSAHLERLENEDSYGRFVQSVNECVRTLKTISDSGKPVNWLGMKVMLKPGTQALAKRLLDDIKAIPDFSKFGVASCSLLHLNTEKSQLKGYSAEETEFARLNW